MARLPKFLNMSAAGRVRLALPTARLAIIAFSFALAAVGMGAFVATLPSASAVDAADAAAASPDAANGNGEQSGSTSQDEATQDDAPAEEGDAASGDASVAAGSYSAPDGTLVAPVTSGSAAASPSGASSSGTGAGAESGSASASAPSGGSASAGSGSSSGSNSGSSSGADSGTVDPSDPFSATPTAAEEAEFHNFLVGWYNKLATAESAAANRDSSPASAGFNAVSSRVRSNYSKWCGAQEGLIGAYRSLFDYACTADTAYYSEYQSWKSQVVL